LTQQQEDNYKKSADTHPHRVKWLTAEECQGLVPGCANVPGLWIEEGMTVYAASYLKGLWKMCSEKGVEFVLKKVHSLEELNHFDLTIVGAGAESSDLPELSTIPLKAVKGQILEFAWPTGVEPLQYPLNSHVYILMSESKRSCLVGATFEKAFTDDSPSVEIAKAELLHKAFALYPPLATFSLIHCHSGLRAVTPQHLPLIRQISPKQWLLTGLGSKGLLYHALYAKKIVALMDF
jgi:glycine/D-amino acid oxidase-like deaminating enzyme